MEEEQPPPASVYPTGKVEVRGEDRSEEAQEGEGGVGCCRGRSRRIGGESETLDSIREAAENNPSNYVLLLIGGEVGGMGQGGDYGGSGFPPGIGLSGQTKRRRYFMRDTGRECVAEQLRPPPFLHTKTKHLPSASRPPRQSYPHTNRHIEKFAIVDVWLLFFSKKVNFMADLCRKYVCRPAVALVETHSFGVTFRSFPVF